MGHARGSTFFSLFLLLLVLQIFSAAGKTYTIKKGEKIQDALNKVKAGDTIQIEEGNFYEDLETKVDGSKSKPITIKGKNGTDRDDVVLHGAGGLAIFYVRHDHYIIKDFTINGKASSASKSNYRKAYRKKLIYVFATRSRTTRSGGYKAAIDGLEIYDMNIKNAGEECIRLRYFVANARIHHNDIRACGIYDFVYDDGGLVGEAIYIGTSNLQWDTKDMPTEEPDVCRDNRIYQNYIKVEGSEGIQIKEGTIDTLVEKNEVRSQRDSQSAGIDCRGDHNIIRYNRVEDAYGAGIRVGGAKSGGKQYGLNNHVYSNTIKNTKDSGIKITKRDQGVICQNSITPPSGAKNYKYVTGDGVKDYPDPSQRCDSKPSP